MYSVALLRFFCAIFFILASRVQLIDGATLSQSLGNRVIRFVRTVTFFNGVKLPFLSGRSAAGMMEPAGFVVEPGTVLYSAEENTGQGADLSWGPLDDIVMGGVSKTNLEPGKFEGVFTGVVSTENSGGFAGIRTQRLTTPFDISACSSFRLRVMGDGMRYKFIARDSDAWNGIAWSYSFDTKDKQWLDVSIKIEDLKPTKFARVVGESPPFAKKNLQGLQITLSKFEYEGSLNPSFTPGTFELKIASIEME